MWRVVAGLVCLLSFAGNQLKAQEITHTQRAGAPARLWKVSLVLLGSASAADAASSWNRREANPLLRGPAGEFALKGLAIKSAIVGGSLAAQYFLLKKDPRAAKAAAIANLAGAATFSVIAARNVSIRGGTAISPAFR